MAVCFRVLSQGLLCDERFRECLRSLSQICGSTSCADSSTMAIHSRQRCVDMRALGAHSCIACLLLTRVSAVLVASLQQLDYLLSNVHRLESQTRQLACWQIEMAALASQDELLHGEAVNIDMALTTHVLSHDYLRKIVSVGCCYVVACLCSRLNLDQASLPQDNHATCWRRCPTIVA